jgi:hypothetical protein
MIEASAFASMGTLARYFKREVSRFRRARTTNRSMRSRNYSLTCEGRTMFPCSPRMGEAETGAYKECAVTIAASGRTGLRQGVFAEIIAVARIGPRPRRQSPFIADAGILEP